MNWCCEQSTDLSSIEMDDMCLTSKHADYTPTKLGVPPFLGGLGGFDPIDMEQVWLKMG